MISIFYITCINFYISSRDNNAEHFITGNVTLIMQDSKPWFLILLGVFKLLP